MIGVFEAIEPSPKSVLDGPIAWCELITKDFEQSKIHLVGAVSVSRMHLGLNVSSIIEEQIKHKLAFMLVRPDNLGVYRHMICHQRISHHSLAQAKIFRGIARLEGGKGCFKLLTIITGMHHAAYMGSRKS